MFTTSAQITEYEKKEDEQMYCRYCWDNEVSEENPLLMLCNCKGSTGSVHHSCLRAYLGTKKITIKEDDKVQSYMWKKFECEICKKGFPLTVKKDNYKFSLADIEMPDEEKVENFIVLESLPHPAESVS